MAGFGRPLRGYLTDHPPVMLRCSENVSTVIVARTDLELEHKLETSATLAERKEFMFHMNMQDKATKEWTIQNLLFGLNATLPLGKKNNRYNLLFRITTPNSSFDQSLLLVKDDRWYRASTVTEILPKHQLLEQCRDPELPPDKNYPNPVGCGITISLYDFDHPH